ncbi:MAG TPA: acetylglutamate kinase [Rhodospirillales bacterium]|jgi:acetylglutamate kinase|nr:MAG: Acetylglutamate kinase [Alphaproteobacteria bacterium MarineAlpha3_Bin2]HIM76653.1 acetylglutamate kinase [Rhodospirillales bacterium]
MSKKPKKPAKKKSPAKPPKSSDDWLGQATVLSEAMPYMQQYAGETFVIKYGGHAMGDPKLADLFARDIVLLRQIGINPIVVHGGGPQIADMLKRLKIKSEFIDGLRVTDEATVNVVEMVLSGSINKQIVSAINAAGGFAIGLSGKDGNLIRCDKATRTKRDPDSNIEKVLDLGLVGEPNEINPHILALFDESDITPVIAPIGTGPDGETLNINADTVAGAIANAVGAKRLMMLTDVVGVLDKKGKLIAEMPLRKAKALLKNGTIDGGMIPKVNTCLNAIEGDVEGAVIIDGRVEHAILIELFTEGGAGTLITRG